MIFTLAGLQPSYVNCHHGQHLQGLLLLRASDRVLHHLRRRRRRRGDWAAVGAMKS
eukprot:COSAG01_NODE_1963_length_8785_cov_56.285402_6_plen_56_part_00